jgi:hypothetical protein
VGDQDFLQRPGYLENLVKPQRRKERKGKTMCYLNMPSHLTGERKIDFMSLFSLRLRVFAVNEMRFLGL